MLGKSFLLCAAASALTLASIETASAGDGWHHHNNDGWVAGAAGLAAGLIVGSAIASQPTYVEPGLYDAQDYPPPPAPRYYRAPQRAYVAPAEAYNDPYDDLRPWSPEWRRYCYDRYASFDGRSGTFVGYDGARHFCTAG